LLTHAEIVEISLKQPAWCGQNSKAAYAASYRAAAPKRALAKLDKG
jgi:hypothetical protein